MIIIISTIIYLPKCIVIKNWGHKPFLKGCYRRHEFRHNPYFENTSEITNFVVYGKDKISFGFQSQEDPEQRG